MHAYERIGLLEADLRSQFHMSASALDELDISVAGCFVNILLNDTGTYLGADMATFSYRLGMNGIVDRYFQASVLSSFGGEPCKPILPFDPDDIAKQASKRVVSDAKKRELEEYLSAHSAL